MTKGVCMTFLWCFIKKHFKNFNPETLAKYLTREIIYCFWCEPYTSILWHLIKKREHFVQIKIKLSITVNLCYYFTDLKITMHLVLLFSKCKIETWLSKWTIRADGDLGEGLHFQWKIKWVIFYDINCFQHDICIWYFELNHIILPKTSFLNSNLL